MAKLVNLKDENNNKLIPNIFIGASDTPANYKTYHSTNLDEMINGTILYEGSSQTNSGNLNDSITNYKRIKIYGMLGDYLVSREIYIPSNYSKTIQTDLNRVICTAESTFYTTTMTITFNNRAFSLGRIYQARIRGTEGVYTSTDSFQYSIYKIVGFKN